MPGGGAPVRLTPCTNRRQCIVNLPQNPAFCRDLCSTICAITTAFQRHRLHGSRRFHPARFLPRAFSWPFFPCGSDG